MKDKVHRNIQIKIKKKQPKAAVDSEGVPLDISEASNNQKLEYIHRLGHRIWKKGPGSNWEEEYRLWKQNQIPKATSEKMLQALKDWPSQVCQWLANDLLPSAIEMAITELFRTSPNNNILTKPVIELLLNKIQADDSLLDSLSAEASKNDFHKGDDALDDFVIYLGSYLQEIYYDYKATPAVFVFPLSFSFSADCKLTINDFIPLKRGLIELGIDELEFNLLESHLAILRSNDNKVRKSRLPVSKMRTEYYLSEVLRPLDDDVGLTDTLTAKENGGKSIGVILTQAQRDKLFSIKARSIISKIKKLAKNKREQSCAVEDLYGLVNLDGIGAFPECSSDLEPNFIRGLKKILYNISNARPRHHGGNFVSSFYAPEVLEGALDGAREGLVDNLFKRRDDEGFIYAVSRKKNSSYKTVLPSFSVIPIAMASSDLFFALKISERCMIRTFRWALQDYYLHPYVDKKVLVRRRKEHGKWVRFPSSTTKLERVGKAGQKAQAAFSYYYYFEGRGQLVVSYTLTAAGIYDPHLEVFSTYDKAFDRLSMFDITAEQFVKSIQAILQGRPAFDWVRHKVDSCLEYAYKLLLLEMTICLILLEGMRNKAILATYPLVLQVLQNKKIKPDHNIMKKLYMSGKGMANVGRYVDYQFVGQHYTTFVSSKPSEADLDTMCKDELKVINDSGCSTFKELEAKVAAFWVSAKTEPKSEGKRQHRRSLSAGLVNGK